MMSNSLKKKNHWTNKVHEAVVIRSKEGEFGFELKGGAEIGQFPYFGEVKQGKAAVQSGKLAQSELLLEVNNTAVAGLTTRDVLAIIKHCKDPVRFKCVKQALIVWSLVLLWPRSFHSDGTRFPLLCNVDALPPRDMKASPGLDTTRQTYTFAMKGHGHFCPDLWSRTCNMPSD
ncbi:membrane-associated guanylate kinase, WW and PDZ domain-containing protein 2 isoform X1 [Oncorhynchus mykiss]|uniref:PDZ domain-containing protein n=3 Tax=Oncorhynchus mykiss TaxID=8022 RepID=A0A8C7NTS6_ONCMY|nr:membrane-associated guanylate kinase, WW and PDZ domain-containing protein 2 isoform X1 [Oncorhynchus mykiss]